MQINGQWHFIFMLSISLCRGRVCTTSITPSGSMVSPSALMIFFFTGAFLIMDRSINSTDAGVRRHRLTLEHPRLPWEFRMNIYVFPAALEDCTITQTAPASKVPMNWDEVPTEQLEYSTEEYYEQTY